MTLVQQRAWEETRKHGYWRYMARSALLSWSLAVAFWAIFTENGWGPFEDGGMASVSTVAIVYGIFQLVVQSAVWFWNEREYGESVRRDTGSPPVQCENR